VAPKIDPSNTWVTADSHFGHAKICEWAYRPLDFDRIILEEWAQAVPETGVVLHLGDLSFRDNARFKNLIAPHLTGETKLLVQGNHDKGTLNWYRSCGFQVRKPFSIDYKGTKVYFRHYPWSEKDEGRMLRDDELMVHGHIHNSGYGGKFGPFVPFNRNHVNISAEMTKYRPVNLEILLDAVLFGYGYGGI
jgi:calcineurin-like phosphoesterase family protein